MIDLTQRYYRDFAAKYGFADSKMRGTGYAIITAPIGEMDNEPDARSYAKNAPPRSTADQVLRKARRASERAEQAKALAADLRALVGHVRNRIEARPTAAAREAYADAVSILAGKETDARGGRNEVLAGLVRLLQRYA
jgi:hypothetical protein